MRTWMLMFVAVVAATPLAAQDYRFTKEMAAGSRLVIDNINGDVSATQGTGRTAEIVVTKSVTRGDGNLVKAVLEEDNGVIRVCTIYLNRNPGRKTCSGDYNDSWRRRERLNVEMTYVVRVPVGVRLDAETVNGSVSVIGLDAPVRAETVNGGVEFEGTAATALATVNGQIRGVFTRASWEGTLRIETVNGKIDLAFPAGLNAEVSGETVNGGINTEFPITIEGKWGPKSFRGIIGSGGRSLKVETVNGGITLRKR